jgi:Interferon-induced transmembrane protein.
MAYCANCGKQVDDHAVVCVGCGVQLAGSRGIEENISSNMGLAIFGFLLFWPTGIAAILNATAVHEKIVRGDFSGAKVASARVMFWFWWCVGVFFALFIIFFIIGLCDAL